MDDPPAHDGSQSGTEVLKEKIRRRTEEDEAAAYARFCETITQRPREFQKCTFEYLGECFEIGAHWNLFLVSNYESVDSFFDPYLKAHAELVLERANEMASRWPARYTRKAFLRALKNRIIGRSHHWTAAALKRARGLEPGQTPLPEPQGDVPEWHADLAAVERKALLAAFKARGRTAHIRITDEMVAKAANPDTWNDRTMVTWWKRNDPRCRLSHDRKIRAVLTREPAAIWPAR